MTSSKMPWFFAGLLCCFFVLAVGYVHAESADLLGCGDGEDAAMAQKWGPQVRPYDKDAHSGLASIHFPGLGSANSPDFVEIDPSKTYELSGWFRSLKPEQPSRVLLDLRYYTADKTAIKPRSVRPVSKVSLLPVDAAKGALEIKIAQSDWPKLEGLHVIVFNAKEDLSDLPNFEYARFGAPLKKTDDGYIVTLKKPLPKAYPAGTGIRLHRYLDHPRVWANPVPNEWTRLSFQVAADPVPGSRGRNYFWPGAKYMRVAILHQNTQYPKPLPEGEEPPALLFDDIEIREVAVQLNAESLPQLPPDSPASYAKASSGNYTLQRKVKPEQIVPEEYGIYRLGTVEVTEDSILWLSNKSWQTGVQLGDRLYKEGLPNRWAVFVSLKFEGSTYGGEGENKVWCDRVIVIQKNEE